MTKWMRARKRPVIVKVREVEPGENGVETLEGYKPCDPDEHLIIEGVNGEEYPIAKEIFEKTYDYVPPDAMSEVDVVESIQFNTVSITTLILKKMMDKFGAPTQIDAKGTARPRRMEFLWLGKNLLLHIAFVNGVVIPHIVEDEDLEPEGVERVMTAKRILDNIVHTIRKTQGGAGQ